MSAPTSSIPSNTSVVVPSGSQAYAYAVRDAINARGSYTAEKLGDTPGFAQLSANPLTPTGASTQTTSSLAAAAAEGMRNPYAQSNLMNVAPAA